MTSQDVYILIPASKSWVRLILSPFIDTEQWWMTYRLPFQRFVRITHPDTMPEEIAEVSPTLRHEKHHVRQFMRWWGPWVLPLASVLFPLPVLFSGRWFIERGAYLEDIREGRETVETAVVSLWVGYLWPWPKGWMRRWFEKELGR